MNIKAELKKIKALVAQHTPGPELPSEIMVSSETLESINQQVIDKVKDCTDHERMMAVSMTAARMTLSERQKDSVKKGATWQFSVCTQKQVDTLQWGEEETLDLEASNGNWGVFVINPKRAK